MELEALRNWRQKIAKSRLLLSPPPSVWNLMCKIYLFQARKCVQSNRHPKMYLSRFATGFFQFNICFVFMSFLLNCHCRICPSEKKHIKKDTLKNNGAVLKQSGRTPSSQFLQFSGCFDSQRGNQGPPLKVGRSNSLQ